MDKESWYSFECKGRERPSLLPDLEPPVVGARGALERKKFQEWRFETKYYMVLVPDGGAAWETIIAVNKETYTVDFQDAILFPARTDAKDYNLMKLAACMRFVNWLKKKEAAPFFKANLPVSEPITEEQALEMAKEFQT